MSTPRRRLVRLPTLAEADGAVRQRQLPKHRAKLEHERLVLTRWLRRLKRAFNAFMKCQDRVTRLERELAKGEVPANGHVER